MKAIWLCSWYPNLGDNYRGDFIQRHAIAVSALVKVDIIHVVFTNQKLNDKVNSVNNQLTEHIFYRPQKSKWENLIELFTIHQTFIKQYIKQFSTPDIIHVHIPLMSGLVALYWKWKYNYKFILTEHYGIYNIQVEDNFLKRNFLFKYFTKKIIKASSSLLPVSTRLGQDINNMVIEKPFTAIANVVNTELFCFENSPKQNIFQFVHISDMSQNKNVQGIMDAVFLLKQKRSDFTFLFIGKRNVDIINYATAKNILCHCHFVGEIAYNKVAELVKQSHAGILFSFSESQSCVVLECLCAGLPIISSKAGGVEELIHEENGILVEVNDSNALAMAMETLMDNYKKFDNLKISNESIQKYSYDAVAKQILNIYKQNLINK